MVLGLEGFRLTHKTVFTILFSKKIELVSLHPKGYVRMKHNFEDLESEVMQLGMESRARLAQKLLLSLDAPSEEENLHLWVIEAERRLQDLRTGKAKELTAEKAFRRARAAIL